MGPLMKTTILSRLHKRLERAVTITEKASKPPLTENEWWDSLSEAQQKKYIEMHPGSPHAK
jgi:hypothetical protein